MKSSNRDSQLRQLLRSGDPLPPGEELSPATTSRMRRSILAAAQPIAPRPLELNRGWQAAAVAAALTAVVTGGLLLSRSPWDPTDDPESIRPAEETATHTPDRQIQFTTRGGTRVIWLLKPKRPLDTQP